jgi:cyclohexanone monooxygenase
LSTDTEPTIDPARPFDPDALRKKYREERDKRIRPEGNDQYQEMAGGYAHYLEDPYVAPIEREPLTDEVDVVIIRRLAACSTRLRQGGRHNRIIEKGGDGGTRYWNPYRSVPASRIYPALLEESVRAKSTRARSRSR